MGNGDNIEQRPQSYNVQEVAGYVGILGIALFCIGVSGGIWAVSAGWCDWWAPLLIGGTVASAGMVVAAVLGDLNGDGIRGDPRLIYVRGVREAQRHKEIEEAERFRLFLQGVYGERGPTWRAWEGALTQEQWQRYCGRLLDANLAERKGETSALTLTSAYRDALRVFAEIL